MPKSAAQRMTPAQIRQAAKDGQYVAVATGFKRGFTMDAHRALVVGLDRPRTVFSTIDDLVGRDVYDGVAVYYDGQDQGTEDCHVVAPTDVLDIWTDYIVQRDARLEAQRVAREDSMVKERELAALAASWGGTVISCDGKRGVFVPYGSAVALEGS